MWRGGGLKCKREVGQIWIQKGTRKTEDRGIGWKVRDNRRGLENYNSVPPLTERRQSAPNNGSIYVSFIRVPNKESGLNPVYQMQDQWL